MKTPILICLALLFSGLQALNAQIGTRFPSERKVVKDPVTGQKLIFLTSQQGKGDGKIYQTHNQWTFGRKMDHLQIGPSSWRSHGCQRKNRCAGASKRRWDIPAC